jgi:hypothetical protein
MEVFIRCVCDGDYSALIISGKATTEELTEAWVLLLSEYQELKGEGIERIEQVKLSRDIWKLRNHLQLVDTCVQFLAERYSESIAASLRQLGYSFKPTDKTPLSYIPLLNSIINKTKLKYVQLKQLVIHLEAELEKVQPKTSRESFETTLIAIEEMQKCTYDFERLTVSKFIALEKKLNRQIELMENKWQTQNA